MLLVVNEIEESIIAVVCMHNLLRKVPMSLSEGREGKGRERDG